MHTMPPIRDSKFHLIACGDRCNYSIIKSSVDSFSYVQQSISLLDWIVFCMSIIICHSVRLASLPSEASSFSYPSGQDQFGTLSVDIWLISKWLISSRWEARLLPMNTGGRQVFIGIQSLFLSIRFGAYLSSLNNIMFFLQSTSFVILKFVKHFDAIDEEHIELVMS